MNTVRPSLILCALATGFCTTGAFASGFQLLEQNASGLGNAYAGSAAVADNASTIFFNPAGMTRLPGINVSGGITAIRPSFKFSNDGSRGPGGMPLGANTGGDAGSVGAAPNLYGSWEVTPKWFVGLGVGVPFGLKTEYDDNWIGRYHSRKFDVKSANINPSVAYKVSDRLSVGAGLNWTYIEAEYQRAVPSVAFRFPPGAPDAAAQVNMRGTGWGWNAGLLYDIMPATRLGLSYRSRVKIDVDGHTKVNTPAGQIARVGANATVKLPDTAVLSLTHELNSQWQLLADVSWTGWSSLQALEIDHGGKLPNDKLDLRFRDTWRVALGARYRVNETWTLKGGVAWDQAPIRDATHRLTSLPDSNRVWVSIGAQYNFSKNGSVDIGYTHLFAKRTEINNTTDPTKRVVAGDYKANANILGVQVSYRF